MQFELFLLLLIKLSKNKKSIYDKKIYVELVQTEAPFQEPYTHAQNMKTDNKITLTTVAAAPTENYNEKP